MDFFLCFSVRNCQPAFYLSVFYLSVTGFFCKTSFSFFLYQFKFIYFITLQIISKGERSYIVAAFLRIFFVFLGTELSTSFLFIHHWFLQKVFWFSLTNSKFSVIVFWFSFLRNKIRRPTDNFERRKIYTYGKKSKKNNKEFNKKTFRSMTFISCSASDQ